MSRPGRRLDGDEPAPASAEDEDLAWWRARLAGDLDAVDLTPTGIRPDGSGRTDRVPVPLADSTRTTLADWAARCGVPRALTVVAAVAALLHRYTGATDLLIGTTGIGVPAVRVDLDPDEPPAALVEALADDLAEARWHPTPPTELFGLVGPGGVAASVAIGPPTLDPWGADVVVSIAGPGAPMLLGHDPDVLPAEVATIMAADLGRMLAELPRAGRRATGALLPDAGYGRAARVDPASRHGSLGALPPPLVPADLEHGVAARFSDRVARSPDAPAVLAHDGHLTYAALAERAGAVAAALRDAGLRPGDRVGLLLCHGVGPVVGILGTLAAGGCYVPLDPEYPPDRLDAMASAVSCAVLLTDEANAELADALRRGVDRPVLRLDSLPPAAWPDRPAGAPDDPAYLLFTSGSTAEPKAVAQNQRNVLYGALNHARSLRMTPADRTSVLSSFSFDMAVTDLFSALLTGAAAVPVDIRTVGLGRLAEELTDHGVTVYHSTPTVFRYLVEALGPDGRLPSVRAAVLGGEEVLGEDVQRCRASFAPDCVFVNGYGATEVSFAVQNHLAPDADPPGAVVPIGHPVPGMRVELRDPLGYPTRLTGEITVTGRHVAPGYWNDPERTEERFTEHGDGIWTYRTGDLGRRLPDGSLCYLGRLDRQVKIRGYRVELGEVESALDDLPGVSGAAAVVDRPPDRPDEPLLVGYVVPADGVSVDADEVRAALADVLPHYLVPTTVVSLEELPLTPTGKVDTAALPRPDDLPDAPADADDSPTAGVAFDGTAAVVAAAWEAVLDVGRVRPGQHFFDLGGHSLLLARVQQRLERELDRTIPLRVLFDHPTVDALAAWLDPDRGGHATGAGDAAPAADDPGAAVHRARDRAARRRAARGGPE